MNSPKHKVTNFRESVWCKRSLMKVPPLFKYLKPNHQTSKDQTGWVLTHLQTGNLCDALWILHSHSSVFLTLPRNKKKVQTFLGVATHEFVSQFCLAIVTLFFFFPQLQEKIVWLKSCSYLFIFYSVRETGFPTLLCSNNETTVNHNTICSC